MEKLLGVSLVILWLQLARVNSQQEEQNLQALSVQEGENATVNCSYKISIDNLQWYRQDAGRGLARLILIRSNKKYAASGRLQVTLDTSSKSSSLSITASRTTDSGIYFCAVEPQCSPGTCNLYTNPQLGSAPPPTTIPSQDRHTAFIQLNIPDPHC
uniref:Ig-like domain-containing protein n=1 Tax=Equus asinus TaxID=9793 RepID=A0A9L0ITX4_EQUAS